MNCGQFSPKFCAKRELRLREMAHIQIRVQSGVRVRVGERVPVRVRERVRFMNDP